MDCTGILNICKTEGMTSHDVVNKVRKLYHTKQVGHTGTLDPMATGVLPVMVGRAVKASEYLLFEDKIYLAGLQLGVKTDTEDLTGKITERFEGTLPTKEEVFRVCQSFTGPSLQIPPMYSALKVHGKKLCDLARQNIEIERKPREIFIYSIEASCENEETGAYFLKVHCSKGTYIRTLCADIGNKLQVGGAMSSLCRRKSGPFSLENALTLKELEEYSDEEREKALLPVENLFLHLPKVELPPFYARLASCGCEIYEEKLKIEIAEGTLVRLYRPEDGFFALGQVQTYEKGPAIRCVKQFIL